MLHFLLLFVLLPVVHALIIVNRRQAWLESAGIATAAGILSSSILPPLPLALAEEDPSRMMVTTPKQKALSIPRVGYSLYKTDPDQVERCIALALEAGVKHFDVATQYGSNEQVGNVLKPYFQTHSRQGYCITHKVSNEEQSKNGRKVKMAVKKQMKLLGVDYLDIAMIHSPLTDTARRLQSYQSLLDLQSEGVIRAVGVCHYGVNPLGT